MNYLRGFLGNINDIAEIVFVGFSAWETFFGTTEQAIYCLLLAIFVRLGKFDE